MNWIKRSDQQPEIKDDLSEEYLAWNGTRMGIIRHGYDNVWLIEDGLAFDFTHWRYLPEPPKDQP
jgi:hypothetical protein